MKPKKEKKVIKAWAIVNKDDLEICSLVINYLHLEIHATENSAVKNIVDSNEKVVPCEIKIL